MRRSAIRAATSRCATGRATNASIAATPWVAAEGMNPRSSRTTHDGRYTTRVHARVFLSMKLFFGGSNEPRESRDRWSVDMLAGAPDRDPSSRWDATDTESFEATVRDLADFVLGLPALRLSPSRR